MKPESWEQFVERRLQDLGASGAAAADCVELARNLDLATQVRSAIEKRLERATARRKAAFEAYQQALRTEAAVDDELEPVERRARDLHARLVARLDAVRGLPAAEVPR